MKTTSNSVYSSGSASHWVLGDMEPINQSLRASTPDRRRISIRWLLGSVLAGVTSLVLMGGALFTALDGRQQLAPPANSFLSDNYFLTGLAKLPKATRGARPGLESDNSPARSNIMMVSTIKRENDRDVVKVRPFMVIKVPLAIAPKRKVSYPRFNPLTVFSESGKPEPISKSSDSIYGAEVESEVSIKVSPFPHNDKMIVVASRQHTVEIEELVRRTGPGLEGNTTSIASTPNIDPDRFSVNGDRPYATPGVVITAENVSIKDKINPEDYAGIRYDDRIIRVRTKLSIAAVFKAEGMGKKQADAIQKILSADLGNRKLQRGDRLRTCISVLLQKVICEEITVTRISIYRGMHVHRGQRGSVQMQKRIYAYSQEPAPTSPTGAFGTQNRQAIGNAAPAFQVFTMASIRAAHFQKD